MGVEGFLFFLAFVSFAMDSGTAFPTRGLEMVQNVSMVAPQSTGGVRRFVLSVGGQRSLEFRMHGCGGLRLNLLHSPLPVAAAAAAADHPFAQVYLGYDTSTHGIIIRECYAGRERRCEDRVPLKSKVVFCYDYAPFWIQWNESTVEIGGGFYEPYSKTLISFSPPPPSPHPSPPPSPPPSSPSVGASPSPVEPAKKDIVEGSSPEEVPVRLLAGIRSIEVENENSALFFTIYRGPKMNYCFVRETEESIITQCGDDYIVRDRCLDCGCCYDANRQPPCYESLAVGSNSSENCSRSLEELFPEMHLFPSPQPIYVNATVDHLFAIGTFLSPQFQFGIDFGDDHLIQVTNFTRAEPLPAWLPKTLEFQNLKSEKNLSTAQLNRMYRSSIVHIYKEVKTFHVNLHVSGQLKRNESSWTSWNKSATVTVHGRPTLEEALNGTFLFSSSPVHRLSTASFFYLVRNTDPTLVCTFVFADGSPAKNVSLAEMRSDQIPGWMANGSFISADEGDSEFVRTVLADIGQFRGGEVQHVFHSVGLQFVNLTVSGNLKSVGVQASVTRSAAVKVMPSLMDAAGPMLFISRTPAYVGIPVHFLFLIRNYYPSLRYEINYGEGASAPGRLEMNFNGAQAPDWVQRKYYKLHGVDRSYAEKILGELDRYNCSLVSYVYYRVRRHTTKVTVSGTLAEVGRHEQVALVSIVDVIEQRKTIWELLATFVLLTSKVNYVNETTYFLYRFGDFSDDLELLVDYGDSSQTESLSVTGSATLPHWARSGLYESHGGENRTAIEQVFSDPGDSFLGGVSGHDYAHVGAYNVTLTVRGTRNVTHGEIQRHATVTVQRRPTLSEVVGQVLVIVRRPVYEGTNTTVLVLVENHFLALSYDLHFGDDSRQQEILVGQDLGFPVWGNSPQSSYLCPEDNCTVVAELLSRAPNVSSALIRHVYATPGPRNVSVTVSGWLELVARLDEHRSAVVAVEVKPRPRMSDALGPSVLLVSDPAEVDENVRFLFIGSRLVVDVEFRLDFGDGSPVEFMTPISTNLDALYWMSDQRFVALGALDAQLSKVVWDLSRFNGTAATQTHVYAAESVYPVYLRLSAEFAVPLEMGRFNLKVGGRRSSAMDRLPLATASDGDQAASTSSSAAAEAAAEAASSPVSFSSPPSTSDVADADASSKDNTSALPATSAAASSAAAAAASDASALRCGSVEIVVTGGGLQRQSPAMFSRRDTFHLKAHVLSECHRHLLDDVIWKVYRLSDTNEVDMVEIWMPTAFVSATEVHVLRFTMDYGAYKVQAKIVKDGREFLGDAYVAVTSSPLTVKILGDDVIQTDTDTPVTVKAEAGIDIDEPRELGFNAMTFEWLCMNAGEKSPYSDALHDDNAEGVGCYGNGRRMNSTSKEFTFDPDLLYYSELPTFFTIQVALTKPNRLRALASQSIVVIYPENPLRVRCTFNCGAYLNTWMELVLNTTCGAPVCRDANTLTYRWDFLPLCPQNSVKQLRWKKDTVTDFNQSSIHVRPNVFNSSQGSEPYQFTLTVTVDNSRQFEARYQFVTRRPSPVVERAKIDQAARTDNESNHGECISQLKNKQFVFLFLPQMFLFLLKTA